MANLSKSLPDGVHRKLKGRRTSGESQPRKMMRKSRSEFRKFLASLPRLGDSVPLIREDRENGHPWSNPATSVSHKSAE